MPKCSIAPAEADVRSAAGEAVDVRRDRGSGRQLRSRLVGQPARSSSATRRPGQIVGPTTNVFTVADLTHVWITVDVYEADFTRVHAGAKASCGARLRSRVRRFEGRVRSMGGIVDTASHTFKVRVVVENQSRRLASRDVRAGAHRSALRSAPASGTLTLPEIAVQDVNGKSVVFVATTTSGSIRRAPGRRRLAHWQRLADDHERDSRVGERVVVKGAFQIKAELMKASFGEDE